MPTTNSYKMANSIRFRVVWNESVMNTVFSSTFQYSIDFEYYCSEKNISVNSINRHDVLLKP